jgi:hypothetical protein
MISAMISATAAGRSLVGILLLALLAGCTEGGANSVRRGRALTDQARYDEAHAVLVGAVERVETSPGPSVDRALAFYALGYLYLQYPPLAEPGEAAAWLLRAQREYEETLGPNHPAVAIVLSGRAEAARDDGDSQESARASSNQGR